MNCIAMYVRRVSASEEKVASLKMAEITRNYHSHVMREIRCLFKDKLFYSL